MIWLVVAVGLILAVFGAMAGGALIALSRSELTRVVSRRLRGAQSSMASLGQIDLDLTTASATTSLGVLLLGAAIPALLVGSGAVRSLFLLVLVAVPFVLFSGYFVPRWLTPSLPGVLTDRLVPVLRRWSSVLRVVLPARSADRPQDLRAIWREGAAVGLTTDSELVLVGGVMTFTAAAGPGGDDSPHRDRRDCRRMRRSTTSPRSSRRAAIAGFRFIAALWTRSSGCCTRSISSSCVPATRSRSARWRLRRPAGVAAICCSTCSASGAISPCCSTSSAEPSASRPSRICWKSWSVRSSTSTMRACRPAPGSATVFETDGTTPASAVGERFGVTLPAGQASTIGGLVAERAGRIPNAGDRFTLLGSSSTWSRLRLPVSNASLSDPVRPPLCPLPGRAVNALTEHHQAMVELARAGRTDAFVALAQKLEPADLADILAHLDEEDRLRMVRACRPGSPARPWSRCRRAATRR